MPGVPYSSPFVEYAGFQFNYNDAFLSCASQYGFGGSTLTVSSFNTASISSATISSINGTSYDTVLSSFNNVSTVVGNIKTVSTFNTASVSSLNVSSINGAVPGGGGLPAGTTQGSWLSYNGSNWIEGGASGNIKLGYDAGFIGQDINRVAIGESAGNTYQQTGCVALGFEAGKTNQGEYSIAIGYQAGQSNQPQGSIILAAGGALLNAAEAGGTYVNAIRNVNSNTGWLTYNNMTCEITYDTSLATSLGSSNDTPSLATSVWAYSKQGGAVADSNLNTLNTQFTANGSNAVGTSTDTPSLTTSLWAYSKQAEVDAQTALIPNTSLQSAIRIIPFPSVSPSNLVWTTSNAPSLNVPLAASTKITCLAPIAPADNINGWRFAKTYSAIVATSGLTSGATYTILVVGNTNWTAIGASAAAIGNQFTYSGAAITGTTVGTCQSSTKMSWYQRNMLYGLPLPNENLSYNNIQKSLLKNAWFLVKLNADIAQQGVLSIQIETYAFKSSNNTTNDYTGRWAYSFPNQQNSGFTAGNTTDITITPTIPRLKAGFTYLLYALDDYPSASPTTYTGSRQFLPYGAGLFPSQIEVSNTLRNPYDIYPEYPHFAMSGCKYEANAIQPPYGGVGEYIDAADVEVSAIYLNSSSTAPNVGVGQTVLDFTVLDWGYTLGASPTITTVRKHLTWA